MRHSHSTRLQSLSHFLRRFRVGSHCVPYGLQHHPLLAVHCRSSALLEGLGWAQPLAGSAVAAQLLALGRMHAAGGGASVPAPAADPASSNVVNSDLDAADGAAHGPHGASTAVSQMLAQLIPQLYRALDALPADEFKAAAAVVSGAAVVWVGNGFAETDRVALRYSRAAAPEACGGLCALPCAVKPDSCT